MGRYAIVEDGKVGNVTIAESPLFENWIQSDTAQIGWLYDGQNFTAPPPEQPKPKVVIVGLSVGGNAVALSSRIIISAGQSLSVTARSMAGNTVLPVTDTFAMPISRVRGDVDQTVRVDFVNGEANFAVSFPRSGEYAVLPEWLNMHLPVDQQLEFEPFYISVTV